MSKDKISGSSLTGWIGVGGMLLAVSGVLPYGRISEGFFAQEYRVPGSMILGLIILLVGVVAALGKRFGSRGTLVSSSVLAVLLAGLSAWFRFMNLSEIQDAGASIAFGWWLAIAGTAFALTGGIAGIVQGSRPLVAATPGVLPTAGVSLTPPPPASPAFAPTHRVPAGGLPATLIPDPSSEIMVTLEAGLPLVLTERRADWAHVRAENGWEGWVDARQLEQLTTTVG